MVFGGRMGFAEVRPRVRRRAKNERFGCMSVRPSLVGLVKS